MSSAGVDTNVNIKINAEDNASGVVNSTTQNLENRFKAHRTQLRMVRMEYELNHRGLITTMRAMQSVGMVVNRAISLYNSWNLIQLRLQTTSKNLADAQRNLNQTLDEFGAGSPEANRALEEKTQLEKDMADASRDAQIQYALMVVSLIADSTRIATSVIPRLAQLRGLIRSINTTRSPVSPAMPSVSGKGGGIGGGLGTAGQIVSGVGGALLGYEAYQNFMKPEMSKDPFWAEKFRVQEENTKKFEKDVQNASSYVLNLIVNSPAQAKQAIDNFFNTYGVQ